MAPTNPSAVCVYYHGWSKISRTERTLVNSYSLLEHIQILQERQHKIITYYYYCSCHYQIGEDIHLCIWCKTVLRSQYGLFSTSPWWESAVPGLLTQLSNHKLTHANSLILKMYSRQDNLTHDKLDKSQGNWCGSLTS